MSKLNLALGLAAVLASGSALAQTAPAPVAPTTPGTMTQTTAPMAGSGQAMTQMQPGLMRVSKLMGVDVYGSDNQKIGDIDEVLVDREGRIQGVVVGVGGFLGIGQKNVAIPYAQVQWMSEARAEQADASANRTTAPAGQPATTGSTGSATASRAFEGGVPERAMVRMSKAELEAAPEFRFEADRAGAAPATAPRQ